MSKKTRRNVFETNSSSTHSICLTKNNILDKKSDHIHFTFGEFGWEMETYNSAYEKAQYLYTAICENKKTELLNKIKLILDANNITYEFDKPIFTTSSGGEYTWLDSECGYIDHSDELEEFLTICEDENKLMRYLFSSESFIITGNDNNDCDVDINVNYEHEEYYKGN